MSDKEMHEYYKSEVIRLNKIFHRTKNKRIKSKVFDRIMKLKDKYDYLT